MKPTRNKEELKMPCAPAIQVEITISKGNQSIRLTPEDYARIQRRMESAFVSSLIVIEEED